MAIVGKPRTYHKKFLFTVEIAGVDSARFQSAGPIEAEVAVVEQWEGGALTADTSPGRMKSASVTLKRGATSSLDLWKWWKQVANIAANDGVIDDQYKRTIDLVQLDRDGSELRRWTLHDAWPSKFGAGDWDNTADANNIESVVLQYRYPSPDDDDGVSTT
jgi:phage tail-like protein